MKKLLGLMGITHEQFRDTYNADLVHKFVETYGGIQEATRQLEEESLGSGLSVAAPKEHKSRNRPRSYGGYDTSPPQALGQGTPPSSPKRHGSTSAASDRERVSSTGENSTC